MTRLELEPSSVAREVLWTYTSVSGKAEEKDFYAALEEHVANELAKHFEDSENVWIGREVRLHVGQYTIQARLANIEPLLSSQVNKSTKFLARYYVRPKDEGQDTSTFLAEIIRYPNAQQAAIFNSLVGLDAIKRDMQKKLTLLLWPDFLEQWFTTRYSQKRPAALEQTLRDRYPLFILEGEVGAGKTALARCIGDYIAHRRQSDLVLFVVNAQIRGGGHVGELTQNISRAFNEATQCQEREQIPVLILIDEADALAQTRGGSQTHHEDDAGVNTLIQCIDRLRGKPIAVLFATNLIRSLDAALLRRACAIYHFNRPTVTQRAKVFEYILADTGINAQDITHLISLTEPRCLSELDPRKHRYTYSDISQRLIPSAIESAIYNKQLFTIEHLISAARTTLPTPESNFNLLGSNMPEIKIEKT